MERIPYTDGEYQAVCDFLIRLNRDDSLHLNWNWARFEWMMEHPAFDKSLRSSIGLWRSERLIVGAAIYDMYFGEAFCAVLPGYERLYPEISEDAFRRLRDETGLAVAICEESPGEIEAARSLGFQPTDRTETLMRLSLERPLSAALPEGFSLVACDPERTDAEALAWMFWRGFDHGEDRAAFEADYAGAPGAVWRPHQKRELCLLALDRDGEYAACAFVWLHPGTDYAYVEPVCTVPIWRNRGLAGALLSLALNRARELGAKSALVLSDLPFYEKLGFRKERRYRFYSRNS